MITFKATGDYKKTFKFLNRIVNKDFMKSLEQYGQQGVDALSQATPVDTGNTAGSWGYEIEVENGLISIIWTNSNIVKGLPIAILLQYGHGTKNGGYVRGRDYINPAIRPVFDNIAKNAWEEVSEE